MEKYMYKNKELEEILEKIDLNEAPPTEEPIRQYYFMKKAQMPVRLFKKGYLSKCRLDEIPSTNICYVMKRKN